MDQELDEFELLWPEYYADHEAASPAAATMEVTLQVQKRCPARSRPVDVPRAALILRRWKDQDGEEGHHRHQLEEDDGAGNNRKIDIVVPPHLMLSVVRRRTDGDTPTAAAWFASSSTRKRARDLRLLRNSVLRMTGFIEG